jgi:uncharacterized protein YdeI (YjbR/CyaY-like superfamily)
MAPSKKAAGKSRPRKASAARAKPATRAKPASRPASRPAARKASPAKAAPRAKASPARPAPPPPTDAPIIPFADQRAWSAWLASHHATSNGVWIKMARLASGVRSVTHPEALDVALCWGWIDGQRRSLDGTYFLQKFTPRRARSMWSKINRDKVLAFIASGAMKPPGLAEIERARRDGRWDAAYDGQSKAEVPDDLAAALAASPRAAAFWPTLDSRNRYAVLHRIHTARKPETRAARIARFVDMLARGEKLHP